MKILVAAATAFEIRDLIEDLKVNEYRHEINVLVTGVGLVAATYSLLKQVSINRPDLVIQGGIAGCFDSSIPKATVVAVKKETIADLGVVERGSFHTIFELGFLKPNEAPFRKGWLVNHSAELSFTRLKKVTAISINEISTGRKKIEQYRQLFDPVVESMEGAALHYVCLKEQIPFIQLRAVSNYVGVRDKKQWDFDNSVKNLNKEIGLLLRRLEADHH